MRSFKDYATNHTIIPEYGENKAFLIEGKFEKGTMLEPDQVILFFILLCAMVIKRFSIKKKNIFLPLF